MFTVEEESQPSGSGDIYGGCQTQKRTKAQQDDLCEKASVSDTCACSADEVTDLTDLTGLRLKVLSAYDGLEVGDKNEREGGYVAVQAGDTFELQHARQFDGHAMNRFKLYVFGRRIAEVS